MKTSKWLIALIGVLLYGVAIYFVNSANPGTRSAIPGTATSAAPDGALAISQLWRQEQLPFNVWEEPPGALPPAGRAVFVSVEPQPGEYSQQDYTALIKWVKQGHRLVWVSHAEGGTLLAPLHVVFSPVANTHPVRRLIVKRLRTRAVYRDVLVTPVARLSGRGLQNARGLYATADGKVLGAVFSLGRGEVSVWTVPAVWENAGIGQAQNLQVPWGFVGNRAILWDEYGHGVVADSMLSTVFHGARALALGFFGLSLLAFAWSSNERFGHVLPDEIEEGRLGTEFIEAISWHLGRHQLRPYAEELFESAVRAQIAASFGAGKSTPVSQLDELAVDILLPETYRHYIEWRDSLSDTHLSFHRRWRNIVRKSAVLLHELGLSKNEIKTLRLQTRKSKGVR